MRPDVPAEVEAVILRCLEKDRTRRYANMGELAVAIAPFASPRGRASAEHVARIFQVATDATATASPALFPAMGAPLPTGASWGNTAPSSPPRRAKAVLLGALGGAAIAVAVGALVMRRTSEPSRGAAEPTPAAGESAAAPTTSATTPTASTTTPVTSAPAPIASAETTTSVVDAGTSVTPARVEGSPTHSKKIVTPPPAPPPVRQKAPDNVFDNRTF